MLEIKGYKPFETRYNEEMERYKGKIKFIHVLLIISAIITSIILILNIIFPTLLTPFIYSVFVFSLISTAMLLVIFIFLYSPLFEPDYAPIVALHKMSSREDFMPQYKYDSNTNEIIIYSPRFDDGEPRLNYVTCSLLKEIPNDSEDVTIAYPNENGEVMLSLSKKLFNELFEKV